MKGKKILYVHGFGSSGQSGTVTRIRELLPGTEVIAPDLPIIPREAMALLRDTCDEQCPDLIIGTSMGGMYTEMLRGFDRILINPAFRIGETILKRNMLGKITFFNPRKDGAKDFIMTKHLQEQYLEMCGQCFSGITDDEQDRVFGLFGTDDPVVDTYGIFSQNYKNALRFHGEHRMNDTVLMHSVMPVIRLVDDRQNGICRNIIYISLEDTMERNGIPMPSMMKTYRYLIEKYDVYIVAALPDNDSSYPVRMQEWTFDNLGVPAYRKLILTNRKDLLYGDYLIDACSNGGSADFMSTRIELGSETFKTWEDILEFFSRLNGQ
ncbi:esterase [Prevotella sp. PMUR]|uniref:Esterase n=2 Tax=Xylanibacter muris TaxID=2736290 RepID=A0ABX2ALP4_9BACT|nr:esterase [Xylanibacter muris]